MEVYNSNASQTAHFVINFIRQTVASRESSSLPLKLIERRNLSVSGHGCLSPLFFTHPPSCFLCSQFLKRACETLRTERTELLHHSKSKAKLTLGQQRHSLIVEIKLKRFYTQKLVTLCSNDVTSIFIRVQVWTQRKT